MAEGNGKPPESEQDMRERLERDNAISLDIPRASSVHRLDVQQVERIDALERHYGDLNTAFGQLRAYALSLGKQEDYQKTVMERNIRAAAADLAIKSATDETKADAGALTTMAGAWLVWLKGGDQQA